MPILSETEVILLKTEVIIPRADRPYVTLTTYILEKSKKLRPAIVVFPGGAYSHMSWREAEPVARPFLAAGFDAFIMRYSLLKDTKFPDGALWDAAYTINYVRSHAEEFGIDPHRVYVIGFSAGAHLAGSIGTRYDDPALRFTKDQAKDALRPDGMVLCYGVLDGFTYAHEDSILRVAGVSELSDEARTYASVLTHVTKNTPPAFLWHCSNDGSVPPENSFLMAMELEKYNIPYELHLYPLGGHGVATATEEICEGSGYSNIPDTAKWVPAAIDWCLRQSGSERMEANV